MWSAISLMLIAAGGADVASPQAVLSTHGLQVRNGTWLLAEEVDLKRFLDALPTSERRYREALQTVDQLLAANEAARIHLAAAETARKQLQAAADAKSVTAAQRRKLDEEIKRNSAIIEHLKQIVVAEERLGSRPPLKPALIELANAQAQWTLAILAARRQIEHLPGWYAAIEQNPDVSKSLAKIPGAKLGPLKPYQGELAGVGKAEATLFSAPLPLFRDDAALRLTAIINDDFPATFSFRDGSDPTVIPRSMADSAGLVIDDTTPTAMLSLDGGRMVTVHAVKIPRLRFGGEVVENVEALVLPPEEESFAARIGRPGFGKLRLELDLRRMALRVTP